MKVEIQNLTKRFGQKTAVDDVSLTLTSGVWGLIGANGAGKTTLMRMLAGILTPTSGRVLCDGADTRALGEAWRDMLGLPAAAFRVLPGVHCRRLPRIHGGAQGAGKGFRAQKD